MDTNVIRQLRQIEQFARDQSVSPYNNSVKERHVRELFGDIANRLHMIAEKESKDLEGDAAQVDRCAYGMKHASLGEMLATNQVATPLSADSNVKIGGPMDALRCRLEALEALVDRITTQSGAK